MLKVDSLNASYGSIRVLKEISIKVSAGEVVSIIGANGAGKSTLLKSISGLMKNSTGRVLYKEQDISGMPANRIVGMGISQVPEGRQIFAHLTVRDNITLGAYHYFKRSNRIEIKERMERVYQMFPILEKRSRQIAGTLSG
ncbi:MAG: ATP-binding cassette domain-containing protein, partial [Desulfobacterales bacterium]